MSLLYGLFIPLVTYFSGVTDTIKISPFSFEEKNLLPTIIIIFSTLASFFLTGLFDYSNEQLEEKFLERSSERNFSIESRDLWGVYLDQIESKFANSTKIQNEIKRIRRILPYSSFFRFYPTYPIYWFW